MTDKAIIHPQSLRDEAAGWLNLRRSGDMTADDEIRFRAWLDLSPGNAEAYRHLERQWAFIGTLADEPSILAAREADDALFDRPRRRRRLAMAAAASLLAVTTGWTMMDSGVLHDIGIGPAPHKDYGPIYRTAHGERSTIRLEDGSVVTLDTDSEVRVQEMAAKRAVELVRGRAHFVVAKDKARPFSVAAGNKRVAALGTAFDVRLDDRDEVIVTLVEGRVRIEEKNILPWAAKHTEMQPGRQLVAQQGERWAVRAVDVKKETSWLGGQLTFIGDPLSKALAEVNRYTDQKIVFRDGKVPDRDIVGVFKAGDAEGFVTAVELNGLGHVVSRGGGKIEMALD